MMTADRAADDPAAQPQAWRGVTYMTQVKVCVAIMYVAGVVWMALEPDPGAALQVVTAVVGTIMLRYDAMLQPVMEPAGAWISGRCTLPAWNACQGGFGCLAPFMWLCVIDSILSTVHAFRRGSSVEIQSPTMVLVITLLFASVLNLYACAICWTIRSTIWRRPPGASGGSAYTQAAMARAQAQQAGATDDEERQMRMAIEASLRDLSPSQRQAILRDQGYPAGGPQSPLLAGAAGATEPRQSARAGAAPAYWGPSAVPFAAAQVPQAPAPAPVPQRDAPGSQEEREQDAMPSEAAVAAAAAPLGHQEEPAAQPPEPDERQLARAAAEAFVRDAADAAMARFAAKAASSDASSQDETAKETAGVSLPPESSHPFRVPSHDAVKALNSSPECAPNDVTGRLELMLRLPSGKRCRGTFKASDPVSALYAFLEAEFPECRSQTTSLVASFPRKPLEDRGKTLQEAGVKNQDLLLVETRH